MISIDNITDNHIHNRVNDVLENGFLKVRSVIEKFAGCEFAFKNDLLNSLRDGHVLCRFMNGLWPNIIPEVNKRKFDTNKENLRLFLCASNYIMKDKNFTLFKVEDFEEPLMICDKYAKYARVKLKRFMNVLNGLYLFISYIDRNFRNLSISKADSDSSQLSESGTIQSSDSYPLKNLNSLDDSRCETHLSESESLIPELYEDNANRAYGDFILKQYHTLIPIERIHTIEATQANVISTSILCSTSMQLYFFPEIVVPEYTTQFEIITETCFPFIKRDSCILSTGDGLLYKFDDITILNFVKVCLTGMSRCVSSYVFHDPLYRGHIKPLLKYEENTSTDIVEENERSDFNVSFYSQTSRTVDIKTDKNCNHSSRSQIPKNPPSRNSTLGNSDIKNSCKEYTSTKIFKPQITNANNLNFDLQDDVTSHNSSIIKKYRNTEKHSYSSDLLMLSGYDGDLIDDQRYFQRYYTSVSMNNENDNTEVIKRRIIMDIGEFCRYIVCKGTFRTEFKIQVKTS